VDDRPAINAFFVSNGLSSGAGSIADSACVDGRVRARRQIEGILARLGAEQIERGLLNPRVAMWI
jgi:hypothetical protein